jgi:hypothetical protein
MMVVLEAMLVRDQRAHLVKSLAREFLDVSAPQADEVLVIATRRQWLVPLESFPEVMLLDEPGRLEEFQGAVDRGLADLFSLLRQNLLEVADRNVTVGEEDGGGDRLTLLRDRQPAIAQVLPKGRHQCIAVSRRGRIRHRS